MTGSQPFSGPVQTASASHTAGAVRVYAPFGGSIYVTSPSRFHDGCPPYTTDYYDSPKFDDGTCSRGVPPASDWAIDFGVSYGANVYIDIEPGTIDGNYGLGIYRVVAGDVAQWDTSANGKYQYFGIQAQTGSGDWENYAWIVLGHIDPKFLSPGTVIAGPSSARATVAVGTVAAKGTWEVHVHQEFYNYTNYSRSYNWDGPTTDNDTVKGPTCVRSGSSPSACNAEALGSDIIGYVGGNKSSFAQVDNPYFVEF